VDSRISLCHYLNKMHHGGRVVVAHHKDRPIRRQADSEI
jgi:hypothetical protein